MISAIYLRADEKALNLTVNALNDIPKTLIGDALRINQVLLNLCNNAVKFTEHGEISLSFDYQKKNDINGILHVSVSDTGIGMTTEQASRIFDSFSQADGSTSRKFGGTGLGLSIVKQLVKLMGGNVSVESTPNQGSCFHISLELEQNNSPMVFDNLASQRIKYLTLDGGSSTSKTYLNLISEQFGKEENNAVLLLDLSHECNWNKLTSTVKDLKRNNDKIAAILNHQSKSLKVRIEEDLKIPVLRHPFSPKQMCSFLSSLCDDEENIPNHQITNEDELPQFKGHVLLVEDNAINQVVASDMLEDYGLSFDIAENGKQAVEMVCSETIFDIVLMDIQMPIMDGYDATRQIRQKGHTDLIICGLSANAMQRDFDAAFACGMNDYITKPIELAAFQAMITKYLQLDDEKPHPAYLRGT